jgi:Ser/Thr protein kinase RdoA (MazF antagonist)
MASPKLIKRILQQYGQQPVAIKPMQTGYRSEIYPVVLESGNTINLILYKREPGILGHIKNANRLGDYLASCGLPARRTVDQRIIRAGQGEHALYGSLYCYLPGKTIPWEAYTMDHIKQLGGTMSRMHALLAAMSRQDLPSVSNEYSQIVRRMQVYFSEAGVQQALRQKLRLQSPNLASYLPLLESLAHEPNQQALHMDFVRGNILFEPGSSTVCGILDFEKAAWGPPIFDIARTLAFLLVDCKYKTEPKIRKYFLQSGYVKRGVAQLDDTQLEPLLNLFLTYDFYKFLRHNPYESLPENEHFTRTRDLLITRGILPVI